MQIANYVAVWGQRSMGLFYSKQKLAGVWEKKPRAFLDFISDNSEARS